MVAPFKGKERAHHARKTIMLNIALTTLTLLVTCSVTLLHIAPALAGNPKERITVMLTGSSCRESQQTFETALRQTDGVVAVDGNSVPGHLLIDVEEGRTSPHDLVTIVYRSTHVPLSCQVEVMQSCITAPRLARSDASVK
jgi:hypothetical protein